MFETGNILFVFRDARTSLHHRRKKLIVEKRSTVVLENFVRDIQTALHPDEHAQLPLIVLLHQDNAFRPLCQSLKLLGTERPEIRVVQIRNIPPSQFIAAHDVSKYVAASLPGSHRNETPPLASGSNRSEDFRNFSFSGSTTSLPRSISAVSRS